jgi:hypothetical protein
MTLRQREPRVKDRKYLGYVAKMPSVVSGREPVHVAHVRYGDIERGKRHTGMGEKPSDKWTIPLTPDEHMHGARSQHANNEKDWWESHGIDPIAVCIELYAVYQSGIALKKDPEEIERNMRFICLNARFQ